MEPAEKEKKKKRGRLKAKSRRGGGGGGGGDGRGVERLSDLRTKTRRKWRRERGSGERAGREKGEGGERPEKKDGEMILVGDWQSAAVVDSSTKGR